MAALEQLPQGGDPDMWSLLVAWLKRAFGSLSYCLPFVAPAFAGAVLGNVKADRRRNKRAWISKIIMSTAAGCLFAPMFSHAFSLPASIANSAACFLAFIGVDGLDGIWRAVKEKGGSAEKKRDDQEPRE